MPHYDTHTPVAAARAFSLPHWSMNGAERRAQPVAPTMTTPAVALSATLEVAPVRLAADKHASPIDAIMQTTIARKGE